MSTDRGPSLLARIGLAPCLVVAGLALARPALAQKSKTDGCLTDATCRASYQKAIDQFDAGKYDEAFANFQSAYQRRQMPWLLVNIGRTAQRLGRPAEAIQYYERYKKAEPNIDAETEKRINRYIEQARALLEQTPEQQPLSGKPSEPPTEVKPAEPPKPALQTSLVAQPVDKPASQPVYKKWWFWTIIGVAVAGGVAGAVAGATLSKSPPPEPFQPDDPIYMPTF
ncbi:MAG: hypothetical protein U1A78_22640 [Polyangia bacterium]